MHDSRSHVRCALGAVVCTYLHPKRPPRETSAFFVEAMRLTLGTVPEAKQFGGGMTLSGTRHTGGSQDCRHVTAALKKTGGSVRATTWSDVRSKLKLGRCMTTQTLKSTVMSMKTTDDLEVRVVPDKGIISIKLSR